MNFHDPEGNFQMSLSHLQRTSPEQEDTRSEELSYCSKTFKEKNLYVSSLCACYNFFGEEL
jgi:hypothetical protein